ncbi:AAA family ATPase [Frigidibacter sp.]|uniref:AAA family ATPase n=1 Tax=Frigidibacter sp. TaxID=2586418 RepID=UPI0027375593|nr:AAA family ATPase [Frigidibacter sp.]MDP3340709.1 AAA family ATPase [Frigidibacter sp.]
MQRIMIVGQPGSGKSTLARDMGRKTGLPVVHIDHIHWQPGWIERSRDDKTRLCHEVEAREAWIFEGGHSATWGNRLARADMLIWLDLPLPLRLWRVVKRTVVWNGRNRPDLPEGCPEGFHRETLPFWRFIWRTRHSARTNIQRLWDSAPEAKAKVRLTSPGQVRGFVAGFRP